MLNVPAYLDRIAYTGPIAPTIEVLRGLHRAHMMSVPFENLDIALNRRIACDENAFIQKIVERRRGGFCYELNGAFAGLLREIGFKVTLLSARVPRDDGSDSPAPSSNRMVGYIVWSIARIRSVWRERTAMRSGSGNILSL